VSGTSSGNEDSDANSDGAPTTYYRSLRLSSEKLKELGLQYGANEARFSVTTKLQVYDYFVGT
jgi:phosphatidate phosphatase PAH1